MDEEEEGFFDRPVPKSLLRFGGFIVAYIVLMGISFAVSEFYRVGPAFDMLAPITDLMMCGTGLVIWAVFFAQFVLPVNKIEGRIKIVERLVSYISGTHGPAIFIENGIIHAAEGETKKRGPGVLWLDSASAAVLRTAVKFTRTIGPGVHFTTGKEYIAATVDLHTLTQVIGPLEQEEAYAVLDDKEKQQALQNRCDETRALTRDNIEVMATIGVVFRIKSKPGEGGTYLGFDADNVRKAVTENLLQGVSADQPVWSPLPARMAADVWREYLRKFKLMQLFEIPPAGGDTALQVITAMMKKRLTQETVEVWDDYGRLIQDAPPIPSQEFARLREMGLEVMAVSIKRLFFQPEVETKLISQWTTQWLKNAQKERDQVERNRKMTEARAQEDALKDFALNASQEISKSNLDEDAQKVHALEMLVHSTFLGVRRSTALLKRATTEQRELAEIFRWLREKRGESNNDIN